MIPLDGLKVKDLESGLFTKHCFALFNPDSGRYVMEPETAFLCFHPHFNLVITRTYFLHIANGTFLRYAVYSSNSCMSMAWGVAIIA